MTGIPIVVKTEVSKEYIKNTAHDLKVDIPEPLTYNDIRLKHKLKGTQVKEIFLDDADEIISNALDDYFGVHVASAILDGGH